MRLHEEYLKRHGIDVPLILYDKKSSLVLRKKEPPFAWKFFEARWVWPDPGHPGYYEFHEMTPRKNGWEDGKWFGERPLRAYYWDEYETALLQHMKNYREAGYIPVPKSERAIVGFEVLLYLFDSMMADLMVSNGERFCKQVCEVLDMRRNWSERVTSFYECWNFLTKTPHHETLNEAFQFAVLPPINNQSQWLKNLIEHEKLLTCTNS